MKRNKNNNNGSDGQDPWLNSYDACQYLSISKLTLYRWVKAKRLHPSRTPGGALRFRRSDLDKILE